MILNCIFHILRAISCSQYPFSFLQLADEALLGASRASNLKDLDNAELCHQAANSVFKVVQGWLERGEEHLHDMPDSQKLLNDFKDTCSKLYVPPTPVSVFAFGCIRI
jgi:predicted nucleotidyltransferase